MTEDSPIDEQSSRSASGVIRRLHSLVSPRRHSMCFKAYFNDCDWERLAPDAESGLVLVEGNGQKFRPTELAEETRQ